jgi:galactokinase
VTVSVGRAPGRLDLLGGVADYSGALVLEVATQATTTVTAEPDDRLRVGEVELTASELSALASGSDAEARLALVGAPSWTLYPVGVAIVLVRHGVIEPPRARLTVESSVPIAMGASSSAAFEVATARALGAHQRIEPLQLALLCQEAENGIVGAPCGVMDQVAVAVGQPGAALPILCRPASVEAPVALPPGTELVGWPSGAAHDIAADPYGRARAAAFMGKRIAEATLGTGVRWTSNLPESCLVHLPSELTGEDFLTRYDRTDDPITTLDPAAVYPVQASTGFAIREHQRTNEALLRLGDGDAAGLRPLLAGSHADYSAMGLGHPATDAIAADALSRAGVHAARTSGGGSGGTVVVLCERGALDDVPGLIR